LLLISFWFVGDIKAPEISHDHVGADLVAMEVDFPDGSYIIDFDVEHLADSVPLVVMGNVVRATVLDDIDVQIVDVQIVEVDEELRRGTVGS
jgi:hypothetical protein